MNKFHNLQSLLAQMKIFFVLLPFIGCLFWFEKVNAFQDHFGDIHLNNYISSIARLVIVAYVAVFMTLGGRRLLRYLGGDGLIGVDRFLASSVLGGAFIAAIVFALGLSGFLYRWLLAFLLIIPALAPIRSWSFPFNISYFKKNYSVASSSLSRVELIATVTLTLVLLIQVFYLLLWKGIIAPLMLLDVVAHYVPYYESVVRQHGTVINEFYWHFYALKGSSFNFLAAVLADVQTIQLMVFYLCSFVVLALYKTIRHLGGAPVFGLLAASIYLGSSQLLDADFQKPHVPIGVFILLAFYFGQMLFIVKKEELRPIAWIFCATVGTVAVLQTVSSIFIFILIVGLVITALIFRRYHLLGILGVAFAVSTSVIVLTLGYNYSATGMFEVFPLSLFMKLGNEARYLQYFSLTDAVFLLDIDGNNASIGVHRLFEFYNESGIAGVLGMILALAKKSFSTWVVITGGIIAVFGILAQSHNKAFGQKIGKITVILLVAMVLILVQALADITPLDMANKLYIYSGGGQAMGLLVGLVLLGILVFQPLDSQQAKPSLFIGILFTTGIGFIISAAGFASIDRLTAFLAFFHSLFTVTVFVAMTSFLFRRWPMAEKNACLAIAACLFCLPINQIIQHVYRLQWHEVLFKPYLKGQITYSEIYRYFGGMWAEEARHHIPQDSIVISLNYCPACNSLSSLRWQHPIFNVYSDKKDVVWYGPPEPAAKILLNRQIKYIVINTSEDLFVESYAPLFAPETIGRFFKLHWASPDGKRFILCWRDGIAEDDPIMWSRFMDEYKQRYLIGKNKELGAYWYPFYEKIDIYGQARFGKAWLLNK